MRFTFLSLVTAIGLSLLSASAPTFLEIQNALTYTETGWTLTDITVFHARPRSSGVSYITFILHDYNKGITLNTNCTNIQGPGSTIRINDGGNGYQCTDLGAGFRYNGTRIFISRSYLDHGFGPPGEDIVTFFGDAAPDFKRQTIKGGEFLRAAKLVIPATSAVG